MAHHVALIPWDFGCFSGHEDIDQVFSVQAQLISRHEINNPEELMQIMDTSGRPRSDAEAMRKARKLDVAKVACETYKLDEVALWKDWVSKLGIRLKGLRTLFIGRDLFCIFV